MSRQHPWRADNPDAVIVARPSKWGNPFPVSPRGRDHAVGAFRALLRDGQARAHVGYPEPDEIRDELAGKDLACWCALDQPCHADVLLELANGDPS
jgi:hypothetical protein